MSLLTKPEELKSKKTFIGLIYGQPGIGKTTLALSAPKPVCIDFDKGMTRVQPQYRAPSLQVESFRNVLELINSNEIDEFDTIVVDTLGKLVDRICDYVAEQNPRLRQSDGQMSQKGWGSVKSVFQSFFKLLGTKNKSLIFVAHETEERNDDEVVKRPDCSGSARKDIVKELDFMGYMEIVGGKRTINFTPSSKYFAKNSLGLEGCIEVTSNNNGNLFISEKIVKLTVQKMEENNILAKKYQSILSSQKEAINNISNVDQVNDYYNSMNNEDAIWDSFFATKCMLADRVKQLGITFDKEQKKFISSFSENNLHKEAA